MHFKRAASQTLVLKPVQRCSESSCHGISRSTPSHKQDEERDGFDGVAELWRRRDLEEAVERPDDDVRAGSVLLPDQAGPHVVVVSCALVVLSCALVVLSFALVVLAVFAPALALVVLAVFAVVAAAVFAVVAAAVAREQPQPWRQLLPPPPQQQQQRFIRLRLHNPAPYAGFEDAFLILLGLWEVILPSHLSHLHFYYILYVCIYVCVLIRVFSARIVCGVSIV